MRKSLVPGLVVCLAVVVSGCGQAQPTMAGGKPVSYWLQALHDSEARQRKKAVCKLGNVGPANPATFPALITALKDPDGGVRCEAILALSKLGAGAGEAIPALTQVKLHDRNRQVRSYAAKLLEKLQRDL